ncbi:LysR family transcriptional regulator [Acidisphaera sp. L21]|uniref:LysR family transcriptional regulator n=1 Tax=Acidisphaera sp. L21 TaxID=1641851 RepID=UPI00131D7C25|nr:LysR family transcriptional regulator [Acidisphaera sp. L21]
MIDKLEFFIAIAREQNFRRAAEACGVAQPTLSAALKQLEESLGVMLVRRNSRYQGLTPEGERVLEWARRLVADARAMRDEVRNFRKGLSGHLSIAAIPTALPYIPVLTQAFQALHADVRVTIQSRSSAEILQALGDFSADIGITYLGTETIGRLRAIPLFTERYRLVTTKNGPAGRQTSVTWAQASRLSLCLLTPDMQNRRILDRLLTPAGMPPVACAIESDSVIALLAHVRSGGWATIVSERVAATIAAGEPFRMLPITEPDAAFQVGLVLPDRQPYPPTVTALLRVVEQLSAPV